MTTTNALNIGNMHFPGALPLMLASFPYTEGLQGLFLFGQGEDYVTRNYAPGKADAVLVGEVSVDNGYCILGPDGYLQTNIEETAEMSLFVIGKRPGTDNVGFVGNFAGTSGGVALYDASGGSNIMSVNAVRGGANASIGVTSDLAVWTMYGADIPNNAASVMRNLTTNVSANTVSTGARTGVGVNGKLIIGRLPASGYNGEVHICAAAIFNNGVVSEDVRNAVAVCFREYAAGFGITV